MDISEHNRRVALNRWENERARERAHFATGSHVLVLKAALCGFLAGDGCVKKYLNGQRLPSFCIKLFPDDEEMLRAYCVLLEVLYNKTPSVRQQKGYYDVCLFSRSVYEDIVSYATFGVHGWSVPRLNAVEERIAWLRAFFSAEGYVGAKSIRVQTTHEVGMNVVSDLLTTLEIDHRRYVYRPRNPCHSTVHIITILKKSARLRYESLIGFWHVKKTEKLRNQQI